MTRPVLTQLDGVGIIGEAELEDAVLKAAFTTITVTADWTAGGVTYGNLRVKRIGNVGFLIGNITCIKAAGPHSNLPIGTVPAGFRPPAGIIKHLFTIATPNVANCIVSLTPAGALVADGPVYTGGILNFADPYEVVP